MTQTEPYAVYVLRELVYVHLGLPWMTIYKEMSRPDSSERSAGTLIPGYILNSIIPRHDEDLVNEKSLG